MFRELSRKHQQLSHDACIGILKQERRGVLSVLGEDDYPYGMPMNHWYNETDGCIYFHCGMGGHRLDALQKSPKASFCVYDQGTREAGEWAWTVQSVIIFGKVEIVSDLERVVDVITKLSYQFTQDEAYIQKEIAEAADHTLLLRLIPEHICGKLVVEA